MHSNRASRAVTEVNQEKHSVGREPANWPVRPTTPSPAKSCGSASRQRLTAAIPIVYFVPQLTVGGTETQLAEMLLRLNRALFKPLVWCPGPWGAVGDRLVEAGLPICRIPLSRRYPFAALRIVRWLRETKPQIFHSFGYANHWMDMLAARIAAVPICVTSRRNVRHWDRAQRVQWCERQRNRWTDAVIANSCAAAAVCANVERVSRDRIKVIYNGVERKRCHVTPLWRERQGIGRGDMVIGNVANLKRVKGQDILLRAFRQVANVIADVYLAICGEGEEREALENLCLELGLTQRVFFLGLRQDMDQIYASFDLYAHASRAEGLPNSILEAMSYGIAVVATSAGGTKEVLAEELHACLVPPEDPSALAQAMIRMLKDGSLRSQMGRAGQKRVALKFNFSRMMAEHESLYLELLGNRNGAS